MDVYISSLFLEIALLEGTCGGNISITNWSGIIMTAGYPNASQISDCCRTLYKTLTEHQEVKLTLLDQLYSSIHVVTICGDTLYLHSAYQFPRNAFLNGQQCITDVRWNRNKQLSWVFISMFKIVIFKGAPRGLMFEYQGEPYILHKYNYVIYTWLDSANWQRNLNNNVQLHLYERIINIYITFSTQQLVQITFVICSKINYYYHLFTLSLLLHGSCYTTATLDDLSYTLYEIPIQCTHWVDKVLL